MNKNIKLYIENKLVEIDTKSIGIALSKQVIDFANQDIRKGSFTYTIKLPLTKSNQSIFKNINNIHIKDRFTNTERYRCYLEVDDVNVIDGYFILRKITENSFEGNISSEGSSLIFNFGEKYINEIKFDEIPFEGLMLPYDIHGSNTREAYESGKSSMLNKNVGFDLRALISGSKNPAYGLFGSSVNYSKYYKTSLVAYNNFPSAFSLPTTRTISNEFSLNTFMPQLVYIEVIKKIFEEAGYNVDVIDDYLNDPYLTIPFFGDKDPDWNWKHLSKVSVYTDPTKIDQFDLSGNSYVFFQVGAAFQYNQFYRYPLCCSRILNDNVQGAPTYSVPLRNHDILPDTYKQFTDIVGLYKNGGSTVSATSSNYYIFEATNSDDIQTSFMVTNGVEYDFLNNMSVFSPPTIPNGKLGQVYTAPADGEYEFDLDITHHIRTYTYRTPFLSGLYPLGIDPLIWREDRWKRDLVGIAGYDGQTTNNNTWMYNGQEQFHAANMVAFIKDTDIDASGIQSAYAEEFEIPLTYTTDQRYRTAKKIRNFKNDSVIAYYNPMLRDLYTGGHNMKFEDYINAEKSILVNPNPIPTGSDTDDLIYQGFNSDTTILNYTNEIGYDFITADPLYSGYNDNYTRAEQYKRKLVRTKKRWGDEFSALSTGQNGIPFGMSKVREYFINASASNTFFSTPFGNNADGDVKFKFKTKLKKGEQIRMVYVTTSQFRMVGKDKYFLEDNLVDSTYDKLIYNDLYADEYNINSLKIRSVDENHDTNLQLGKFLPKIKVKDFIDDFIKSNNLYFNINSNNITFKKRDDYFGDIPKADLTKNMDSSRFELTPTAFKRNITYGLKTKESYDFKADVTNIPLFSDVNFNIYDDKKLVDITSKLLFTAVNKDFNLRYYPVVWSDGWDLSELSFNMIPISLPAFNEGGSSNTITTEASTGYKVGPYPVNFVGLNTTIPATIEYLINGIPFFNVMFNLSDTGGGYLDNDNLTDNFEDRFLQADDISMMEAYFYLSSKEYNGLDLSQPVLIDNTMYYIQKIENFNPLIEGLTKIILLKI